MSSTRSIDSFRGFSGSVFSPRGAALTSGTSGGLIERMNAGETSALLSKGVSTVAAAFASVAVTAAQLETWLKIVALLIGGVVVPLYTLWTMAQSNRRRELELQLRSDEVRVKVTEKEDKP